MKKKLVMEFTDESFVTFQLFVSGPGEFGLRCLLPTYHKYIPLAWFTMMLGGSNLMTSGGLRKFISGFKNLSIAA